MSRLQTLSANRDKAVLFHHGTHSSFICRCMGIETDKTFYILVGLITAIRKKPSLLSVLRNLLENKLWEDINVETRHLTFKSGQ